jgi:hypothetical protein
MKTLILALLLVIPAYASQDLAHLSAKGMKHLGKGSYHVGHHVYAVTLKPLGKAGKWLVAK